jgi:hypothetical protein
MSQSRPEDVPVEDLQPLAQAPKQQGVVLVLLLIHAREQAAASDDGHGCQIALDLRRDPGCPLLSLAPLLR